jgi:arabinogalactan oligomer/maltooligosaccharide transport system substrate-binding protein
VLVPALEQAGTAHTDATGTPVAIEAKDSASTRNDLSVLAPQGQGPDLFVGDSDWVGDLVDSGMLAPVDLAGQ